MFFRVGDRALLVTEGPSQPTQAVPIDAFADAGVLRWCPARQEILLAATPRDARPPDPLTNTPGDVRLIRRRLGDNEWQEVYGGYAPDALCLAGGGYVVHTGSRLLFVRDDGDVERELKLGRFNWGPPALSAGPGGDRIAWVRWRGDDARLCGMRIDDASPREYGVACHRYAWRDDASLVFYLGGPMSVLDLDSGATPTLVRRVTVAGRGRRLGHRTLDRYLSGRVDDITESFNAVAVADARIWFGALVSSLSFRWWWLPRFSGIFSVDLDGGDLQLVAAIPKQEQIEGLVALPGRTAVASTARYRRGWIVERPQRPVGPLAAFLTQGWRPLPTSLEPDFGSRL